MANITMIFVFLEGGVRMLKALRAAVVRCAQAAEAEGLCRWRSGNFSAKDEATGLICLTPWASSAAP